MSNEQENNSQIELVEFTVDGRKVKAPKGKNLLEALLDSGEELSYFCYHRCLSVAAACRQCLVSIGGRIAPSCQMVVSEGLNVLSNSSPEVLSARKKMLEYTLVNHPIDCVICDKAGECALQRLYMDWDLQPSVVNHAKVKKPKKVDLGPDIIIDSERCILCGRCIRFCEEIAKQPQLTFSERGNHSIVTTAPYQRLDNPYSLNTVDICPVGALTDKDFRFKIRVWNLFATPSICNGCSAGCKMEIHHNAGHVYRLVPPKKWDMDLNWMCNFGRRTYKTISENRITAPTVGGKEITLDSAFAKIAQGLKETSAGQIGFVIGADATNEDIFAAAKFAREHLRAGHIYIAELSDDNNGDDILRKSDPNPNRKGAQLCAKGQLKSTQQLCADLKEGTLKALYVVSNILQLPNEAMAALSSLNLFVVQATHHSLVTKRAHIVLPAAMWAEVDGTITNFEGKLGHMRSAVEPPGYARPHWSLLSLLAAKMDLNFGFDSAFSVFAAMKEKIEGFAQANWNKELQTIQLRFHGRRG